LSLNAETVEKETKQKNGVFEQQNTKPHLKPIFLLSKLSKKNQTLL